MYMKYKMHSDQTEIHVSCQYFMEDKIYKNTEVECECVCCLVISEDC